MSWHPQNWSEVCKRSAGRKHINALRHQKMILRRYEIAEYVRRHGCSHGTQKLLASKYRVSPATISKDIKVVTESALRCPTCGRYREKLEASLNGGEPLTLP